jgi:hypothetical protein
MNNPGPSQIPPQVSLVVIVVGLPGHTLVGSPMPDIKGDDEDKRGYPCPPCSVLSVGLATTT